MISSKLKIVLSFVILGLVVVYMFKNMVSELTYACLGTDEGKVNSTQKLYLKLQTYRFPATIWASHDGNALLEYQDGFLDYIIDVRDVGFAYQFFSGSSLKGQLTTSGGVLALKTPSGFFEGKCEVMK